MLLESARRNISHGDRLSQTDKRQVAHTLFYFTDPGDLVMDPMAGGGVVPDVCLLFERKCRAFDLAPIPDRPEIEPFYWTADTATVFSGNPAAVCLLDTWLDDTVPPPSRL